MPKMDGIEVLQETKINNINIPFIILTGHGNLETAVDAMKLEHMILFQSLLI